MTKNNSAKTILVSLLVGIVVVAILISMAVVYFIGKYNEEAEKSRQPLEAPENYPGYEYIAEAYENNEESINIYAIDNSDVGIWYKIGFVEGVKDENKAQIVLDFHNALENHIENNDTDLFVGFYSSFIKQSQPNDILLRTEKNSKEKYLSLYIDSGAVLSLENLSKLYGVKQLNINYYYISEDVEGFACIVSDTSIEKLFISRMDSYVDEEKLRETKNEVQTVLENSLPDVEVTIYD